ncbi:MAG TPA: phosphoribosyltransferase family protein [Nitrospira sp.]|nr:phosphoribosyltransferase family protein [Nitrospira sp.]
MDSLARRIRERSRLTGSFVLRSGAVSETYFDKYRFESDPHLLREIANAMVPLIPPTAEVLAGMEMGGIPVVTLLSQVTGLPAAFIRKQPKTYGTCLYAEGASLASREFLIVEDVVSSGGAILDALKLLGGDGLKPCGAICVIDRETGCKEALAAVGLPFRSLFTMSQINDA